MTCKKCDTCAHRGNVAGSTHSSCQDPLIQSLSLEILQINVVSQSPNSVLTRFNLKSSNPEYTIGFPYDFDPIWLEGHCLQHSDNDLVDTYVLYQKLHNGIEFSVKEIAELRQKAIDSGVDLNQRAGVA